MVYTADFDVVYTADGFLFLIKHPNQWYKPL